MRRNETEMRMKGQHVTDNYSCPVGERLLEIESCYARSEEKKKEKTPDITAPHPTPSIEKM